MLRLRTESFPFKVWEPRMSEARLIASDVSEGTRCSFSEIAGEAARERATLGMIEIPTCEALQLLDEPLATEDLLKRWSD